MALNITNATARNNTISGTHNLFYTFDISLVNTNGTSIISDNRLSQMMRGVVFSNSIGSVIERNRFESILYPLDIDSNNYFNNSIIRDNIINYSGPIKLGNHIEFFNNTWTDLAYCEDGAISINDKVDINITYNTLAFHPNVNCNYSLYMNAFNVSVWLNQFFGKGINITDSVDSVFCVNNQGNFYEQNISISNIGNGTGINGTTIGGDCGPANITMPAGQTFTAGSIMLNWTNQSNKENVSYYIYHSEDSGLTWNYINLTNETSYNWSIVMLDNIETYKAKIVPFYQLYNATNVISPLFTVNISRFITLVNMTKNDSGIAEIVNDTEAVRYNESLTLRVNVTSALYQISTVWVKVWETVK
ncbi:MAG: hypothetical protein KKE20_03710 [Nanoarchaeota archaeon]|nr:hypothetical protein [Nanoarchaeota archaeon]